MFNKLSVISSFAVMAVCMLGLSATVVMPEVAFAGNSKVPVCHIPPGNPDNFHTITVSEKALSAHFNNHGDLGGFCDENCAVLCDDGDACTAPTGECADGFCPPELPVDCNDGNLCTVDSCDSLLGCENEPVQCPDGQSCNEGNGLCEDDTLPPPDCPCFDMDSLMAELDANGGFLSSCGPGAVNDSYEVTFNNGNFTCAGFGFDCSIGSSDAFCRQTEFQNVTPIDPAFPAFAATPDPAVDAQCQALLQQLCESVGGPTPSASESSSSDGSDAPEDVPFIDPSE